MTVVAESAPTTLDVLATCDQFLPLAWQEVHSYASRLPSHVDTDDLEGAALLGLVEAALEFDPSRGVPFDAWARQQIRYAILDSARKQDFTSRDTRRQARAVAAVTDHLTQQLGRQPTREEVGEQLGIEPKDLRRMEARLHSAVVTSLDIPTPQSDLDGFTYADLLVDTDAPVIDILEEREMVHYLKAAVDSLPDRLRELIVDLFYHGLTGVQAAEKFDISEARVSQLRRQALTLLHQAVSSHYDSPSTPRFLPATPAPTSRDTNPGRGGADRYGERLDSTVAAVL